MPTRILYLFLSGRYYLALLSPSLSFGAFVFPACTNISSIVALEVKLYAANTSNNYYIALPCSLPCIGLSVLPRCCHSNFPLIHYLGLVSRKSVAKNK